MASTIIFPSKSEHILHLSDYRIDSDDAGPPSAALSDFPCSPGSIDPHFSYPSQSYPVIRFRRSMQFPLPWDTSINEIEVGYVRPRLLSHSGSFPRIHYHLPEGQINRFAAQVIATMKFFEKYGFYPEDIEENDDRLSIYSDAMSENSTTSSRRRCTSLPDSRDSSDTEPMSPRNRRISITSLEAEVSKLPKWIPEKLTLHGNLFRLEFWDFENGFRSDPKVGDDDFDWDEIYDRINRTVAEQLLGIIKSDDKGKSKDVLGDECNVIRIRGLNKFGEKAYFLLVKTEKGWYAEHRGLEEGKETSQDWFVSKIPLVRYGKWKRKCFGDEDA